MKTRNDKNFRVSINDQDYIVITEDQYDTLVKLLRLRTIFLLCSQTFLLKSVEFSFKERSRHQKHFLGRYEHLLILGIILEAKIDSSRKKI